MVRISLFVFFVLLGSATPAAAQSFNSEIDSLQKQLDTAKNVRHKIQLLNQLASALRNNEPLRAQLYCHRTLLYAAPLGDSVAVGTACNILGVAMYRQGDYNGALKVLARSLAARMALADSMGIANTCANIGNIYYDKGDYTRAMSHHLRALKIHEANNNEEGIAYSLGNIGLVHFQLNDHKKAIECQERSYTLREKLGDKLGMVTALNNMAIVYFRQQKLQSALQALLRALEMRRELKDLPGLSTTLMNIGAIYLEQHKYDKALQALFEAEQLQKQVNAVADLPAIYYNIAAAYRQQKQLAEALKYQQLSLQYARETASNEALMNAWEGLYATYHALGNYREALAAYENYSSFKDSLYNEAQTKALAEIQTRYELEQKENEISMLSKENEIQKLRISNNRFWLILLLALVFVIGLSAFLLVTHFRIRGRQQSAELQQKLLRSQMNPHFIFNSLAAIQAYIIGRQPREAAGYLSSFSKLVRHILENSKDEHILFEKEIQTLETYLRLQQLRFPGMFQYSIHIDEQIQKDFAVMPPMLTQPFLENAIEHGFRDAGPGVFTINVSFTKDNDKLICEVCDNGVGIAHASGNTGKEHRSFAMQITKQRLQLLNRKYRGNIHFMAEDLRMAGKAVQGTSIRFSMPYRTLADRNK